MIQEPGKNLIILTGPTAVGKTAASIGLAKAIGGEIISADSAQVYKGLDIGSAKIRTEEMDGVPHHLIDVLEPHEEFDVVRFKEMATEAMKGIYERGHVPILTGGTGFYIQAVLYDIDFTENGSDPDIRQKYQDIADTKGAEFLHSLLAECDPPSAEAIHANNVRKVIRALEFYELTGERISDHNEAEHAKASPYNFAYFVLNRPRSELYERIDARVDIMINDGLVDEVRALLHKGVPRECTAMQALGYKEIAAYLNGECTLDEAITQIKTGSRHYAKRQVTWFKRERDVRWIEVHDFDSQEALSEHLITEAKKVIK